MGLSEAGKGHDARPLSVDKKTFDQHHEATFGKKIPWWERRDYEEYKSMLDSGMFFELFPSLSGNWETDKDLWRKTK